MTPSFLIASPSMQDSVFERAIIFLWEYDDHGAIGVIVNKPLDQNIADILETDDADVIPDSHHAKLAWGGPLEPGVGTLLTREAVPDNEGWTIKGVGVSRSLNILSTLLHRGSDVLLCLGYAGWGPSQLDDEIVRGSWLLTDLDRDILFDVKPEDRYEHALASLGLKPETLWMQPIDE